MRHRGSADEIGTSLRLVAEKPRQSGAGDARAVASASDQLEYIEQLLPALSSMASASGAETLAGLLDLACREAALCRRRL